MEHKFRVTFTLTVESDEPEVMKEMEKQRGKFKS